MGFGGISIWQLLIILVIVVLLFGTKKLRNMGGDLGGAIKNFKQSVKDGEEGAAEEQTADAGKKVEDNRVIDAEAHRESTEKESSEKEELKG